jgi:hypothetical protein
MGEPRQPELAELAIADPPDVWRALGFEVDEHGFLDLGGVRIRLGAPGSGISSWALRRSSAIGSIDGLPTPSPTVIHAPPFATHPNGATGLDHVVVATGEFDRTAAALARAGIPLKRTREAGGGGRQGFVRIGPAILELVESPSLDGAGARFWGLAVVVISLERLAERLGGALGEIRPAVQQGRRIAPLRESAGLSTALAFISPEPP